jgi:ammonia channel protein AmtB
LQALAPTGSIAISEQTRMNESQFICAQCGDNVAALKAGESRGKVLKVTDALVGLRVVDESEQVGLDLSEHEEAAYAFEA